MIRRHGSHQVIIGPIAEILLVRLEERIMIGAEMVVCPDHE
jgi:hypothetical protein